MILCIETNDYSHRCIEVEQRIFPMLRHEHVATKKTTLILEVTYAEEGSTYGGTKI